MMASLVSIIDYDDEKLVICCRPSSRSWAICFGVYICCELSTATLVSAYIVDRTVCHLPWRRHKDSIYFSNSCRHFAVLHCCWFWLMTVMQLLYRSSKSIYHNRPQQTTMVWYGMVWYGTVRYGRLQCPTRHIIGHFEDQLDHNGLWLGLQWGLGLRVWIGVVVCCSPSWSVVPVAVNGDTRRSRWLSHAWYVPVNEFHLSADWRKFMSMMRVKRWMSG